MDTHLGIIFLVSGIALFGIGYSSAYADTAEWQSNFGVGILNTEDSLIPLKVSTLSEDSLKIQWQLPETKNHEIVTGYEIFRKDLNSGYRQINEISDLENLVYVDKDLPDGYYGYKIVPIFDTKKSDKITKHGIDRKHNLFETYLKGQELIAKQVWNGKEIQSELPNSYSIEYEYSEEQHELELQSKITQEITRAEKFFHQIFRIKINH